MIVGAGPTGLTAAVELLRRGGDVRIVDAKAGPTPLSKAVGVSPHSLEILEPSGITAQMLAHGLRIRRVGVWYDAHRLASIDLTVLRHRFDFLLSLPQSETETIMADALRRLGVAVEWCTRLVALTPNSNGAAVVLESPLGRSHATYPRVFGADGADSTVRGCLRLEFAGRTHHREWSIADAEIPRWPYAADAAQAFLHRNGDVNFVIPIGPGRFRAVANTPDALRGVPMDYRAARLLRTDRFRIPARRTATCQSGEIYLGGDAAHAHSPLGARGMNLGIEDAAAFARRWHANTLNGYTAERLPVARRWIERSERALAVVQSSRAGVVPLRNLALRVLGHAPSLQRPLLERVAGLKE